MPFQHCLTETEAGEWLEYYDAIAEEIDDDILDYCDEEFGITVEWIQSMDHDLPDDYYIMAARMYKGRHGTAKACKDAHKGL